MAIDHDKVMEDAKAHTAALHGGTPDAVAVLSRRHGFIVITGGVQPQDVTRPITQQAPRVAEACSIGSTDFTQPPIPHAVGKATRGSGARSWGHKNG